MLANNGLLILAYSGAVLLVHGLGILTAAHAVMNVRSSQGAIAWGISLITFPWLALPLYWVLGRNHFFGYREALRSAFSQHRALGRDVYQKLQKYQVALPPELAALERLSGTFEAISFTDGNQARLLINGQQTYEAMLAAIATAKDYILLQSYIINDDETGRRFQQALGDRAQAGVKVYVLYDEIGSNKISRSYLQGLRQNGIAVSAFNTTKGRGNRFQLNFRNHRKILVVDGKTAFVGGLNLGDEYLGKDPKLSPWRDTHMQMGGPSVQCLQASFLQDWYWATSHIPAVTWDITIDRTMNATAMILPTGPADKLPACNLFYVNAIHQAQSRIWISSPYFVPDESTLSALKSAALRGVDVRILLPNHPDHLFVYLCSFDYYEDLRSVGIRLYRYTSGFTHQKVIVIDHAIAGVGTVNLDNRSFFLNFEVMGFVTHPTFIQQVEDMLLDDFAVSQLVNLNEFRQKPFWFRLVVKVAHLLAPIL